MTFRTSKSIPDGAKFIDAIFLVVETERKHKYK